MRWWEESGYQQATLGIAVRRIINDLRAALNEASRKFRLRLPENFREQIRDGFAVSKEDPNADPERPNIILDDDEVRLIVKTAGLIDDEQDWGGDLHRMVMALAFSGQRYSQLTRTRVHDLNTVLKRLSVPSSNKGRGNNKKPSVEIPVPAKELVILRAASRGRPGDEFLLLCPAYKRGEGIRWVRAGCRAWNASDITKPFAAVVKRAGVSPEITAYALRHSSIVRQLRDGLPVRLVAAQHDTSSAMIEKFYSRYVSDALGNLVAEKMTSIA